MNPDYGKRNSFNVGNLTIKITADMSEVKKELDKLNQSAVQSKIKADLDKIDYLKEMKKRVMADKEESTIVRSWTANKLEEQIEELKEHIKELIERY